MSGGRGPRRSRSGRARGGRPRPLDGRGALVLLVILFELSAVVLPVLARVPARAAAAITETRLRAAPNRGAEPLLWLPEGAVLTVHGQAENGWYRARRGKLEGYILTGDVATAPIAADAARPGEAIDEPGVVELAQVAGGRERDRRTGRRDAPEPHDTTSIVTGADLNLRAGPSQAARVIAVMPRGARVEPTGEASDGFVEVRWNGELGWALGKHLRANRPPSARQDRDPNSWSRRELTEIIYAAADRYGQPREDMLRVARCESDLVPAAVNGPGGTYGLFQFKPSTWLGTPFAEYDIFDPRASANAAAWMWSVGRRREWVCQ
jgi:uncharacterized protein YgiM (DUF1202 family)